MSVCTLISVRLWNFKDGGSLKARSLAKNQHTQRIFFFNNWSMNYGLSKSAKIIVSKSILGCQKLINFFQFFLI